WVCTLSTASSTVTSVPGMTASGLTSTLTAGGGVTSTVTGADGVVSTTIGAVVVSAAGCSGVSPPQAARVRVAASIAAMAMGFIELFSSTTGGSRAFTGR